MEARTEINLQGVLKYKITPRRKETGELHSILKDDLLIWADLGLGRADLGLRRADLGPGQADLGFTMYKIISALLSFC